MMTAFLGLVGLAFIVLVLLRAVLHKLFDFLEFQGFVDDYQLLPERWGRPVAALLVGAELAMLMLLLFAPTRSAGLMLTAALLVAYAAAIAINLRRGRTQIECGCGGVPQRLNAVLVARNLALAGIALLAASSVPAALGPAATSLAVMAGFTLWTLYLLFEQLNGNSLILNPPIKVSL
ncbi:hypothetical protein GCM10027040_13360 [Halomonas shantousis]